MAQYLCGLKNNLIFNKMKKSILTLIATFVIANIAFAQNFEKLYYKDLSKETDNVTITVDNAVSTAGETKFKLKITNKSNAFVIYKPSESKFIINGKESKPSEKAITVKPNSSNFITINLKGSGYNAIKNYSYIVDGVYIIPVNGEEIKTPNFKLPPAQNDFKTGHFSCTMTDLVKESGKTEVKFKCAYNGDKAGIINNTKAAVKMPDGNEYANAKKAGLLDSKTKEVLLLKGDEETVVLKWEKFEGGRAMDMQKVIMEIVWRDTFIESTSTKSNPETLEFEFDEALTVSKNK